MPNISRRLPLLAVIIIVATALIAGCGVPWSSGVITDRSADKGGAGKGATIKELAPGPDGVSTPEAFVNGYLQALAGRSDSDQKSLYNAAAAFMSDPTASTWTPDKTITVIRPLGTANISSYLTGGYKYSRQYQVLGIFSPGDGTLRPATSRSVTTLDFYIGPVLDATNPQRLQFVGEMPKGLYLSEQGLTDYYRQQPVYFWDASKEVLIAEPRYAPLTVTRLQRLTMIVNWVLAGPSDALGTAATHIVNATLLDPVVSEVDGKVVVDLAQTRNFEATDGLKLTDQLRWSLNSPDFGSLPVVALQVERQNQPALERTITDPSNPISHYNEPSEFAIGDGKVRALDGAELPPLLRDLPPNSANSNVVSAAVSTDTSPGSAAVALVRHIDGEDQLFVRSGNGGSFKKMLTASSMSRPTMIAKPRVTVAVVADGSLKLVDVVSGKSRTVAVANSGKLTDVSVAPDDRRLALVNSKGQLFTSTLIWQTGPDLATPAWPAWPDVSKVTSVAWAGQNELVVSGYRNVTNDYAVVKVNADGTSDKVNPDGTSGEELQVSRSPINHVEAYPYNPIDSLSKNAVMYVTSDGARRISPFDSESQAVSWGNGSNSSWGTPTSPFFAD